MMIKVDQDLSQSVIKRGAGQVDQGQILIEKSIKSITEVDLKIKEEAEKEKVKNMMIRKDTEKEVQVEGEMIVEIKEKEAIKKTLERKF